MVKKRFGNHPETAEGDRHSIRNLKLFLRFSQPMTDQHGEREHTAGDRHDYQKVKDGARGQPQSDRSEHLHVAAALPMEDAYYAQLGEDYAAYVAAPDADVSNWPKDARSRHVASHALAHLAARTGVPQSANDALAVGVI